MLIGSSDHAARLIDLYDLSTIQEFAGHTKSVRSVQFSPDGKSAVTAGDDETIRLWDADTGEEIFIFFGHTGRVHSAAFSPDGGKIVSASGDGTVRLWDVASGRPLHQLAGHQGSVFSAGFGPDGSKVASGGFDGAVRVWDVATGRQLHTRQFDKSVGAVAFSPDGSAVAVGQGSRFDRDIDFKTYIWPILEAKEPITLTGHIRPVLSVAFSQDGSRLATVSDDGTARIWDAKTGKPLRVFDLAGYSLDDVAFDPADERLIAVGAAGSDGAIAMLEPDINELLTAARAAEYGLTKKMLEGLP
jgi:WD40 repeat protein